MIRVVVMTFSVAMIASLALARINSDETLTSHRTSNEKRINANLIRVEVNGNWVDFPMVPLSEQLCRSDRRIYTRYCD